VFWDSKPPWQPPLGRPARLDDRKALLGILFVLKTGTAWEGISPANSGAGRARPASAAADRPNRALQPTRRALDNSGTPAVTAHAAERARRAAELGNSDQRGLEQPCSRGSASPHSRMGGRQPRERERTGMIPGPCRLCEEAGSVSCLCPTGRASALTSPCRSATSRAGRACTPRTRANGEARPHRARGAPFRAECEASGRDRQR
jgi:hypothetical protein